MKFRIEKEEVELNNPIVIEGLPGIGNVARIAVDYMIDLLGAKKFATIYSNTFPNGVFLNDDSVVELPKMELYYIKKEKNDIILLVGDVQPVRESDSYFVSEKLVDLFAELGVIEIVTLGGIGLSKPPENIHVHGTATNKKLIEKLKGFDLICDGKKTVGIIVGAAGLLMGFSKLKNINSVSFLAETYGHPQYMGFKSAKEILLKLQKYLNIEFSLEKLEKEIERIDKHKKSHIKSAEPHGHSLYTEFLKNPELGYIG